MDDKIRSVLDNPELLSKIVSAVRGISAEASSDADGRSAEPAAAPVYASPPVSSASALTVPKNESSDAVALLSALKPFLGRERREKADAVIRALSAAGLYKSIKRM